MLKGQEPCYLDSIYINALLVDPSGSTFNFDTNGDGLINSNDEFVEICNASMDTVDVSSWRIGDDDPPPFPDFEIPSDIHIAPGACLLIVANYCPDLPEDQCVTPSGVLNMGYTFSGFLGNAGDVVSIVDSIGNSCSVVYGSTVCSQIDPLDVPDFDEDGCDDWGGDIDGCPLLALGVDCDYEPVVLSVSLFDFDVVLKNQQHTYISWSTIESPDFDRYEVEWTSDLNTGFETIEVLKSKESESHISRYDYTHLFPVVGNNFYRLKIIDHNDDESFSQIAVVEKISDIHFKVQPTVVNGPIDIKSNNSEYVLRLFDMSGNLVSEDKINDFESRLDFSYLLSGVYILRLETGSYQESFKIIKI